MTTTLTVVRHGETTWSANGKHTGLTDLPLTDAGRAEAAELTARLRNTSFALVLTSPLGRARDTATLAGFPDAEAEPDLVEWDYGDVEGRTTVDMQVEWPGWGLWRDGPPGGETILDVAARATRVVARVRAVDGDVLVFAHGHFLRVLAAVWVGVDPGLGAHLILDPATLSILSEDRGTPTINVWNG
ncbi:MAG: histidine phosphatase family protein [Acidimicrobiales bacterium]